MIPRPSPRVRPLPDATTRQDALAVLAKYQLVVPPSVTRWLNNPASETPKPGDPAFANVENVVIATAQTALDAAAGMRRAKPALRR